MQIMCISWQIAKHQEGCDVGSEPGFAWITWRLPLEIWGLSAPMMLISIVRYGRGSKMF